MGICLIAMVVCQRVLSHTLDGLGFASSMLGTYENILCQMVDSWSFTMVSTIPKKQPTDSKKYLSHEKKTQKQLLLSVILVG